MRKRQSPSRNQCLLEFNWLLDGLFPAMAPAFENRPFKTAYSIAGYKAKRLVRGVKLCVFTELVLCHLFVMCIEIEETKHQPKVSLH